MIYNNFSMYYQAKHFATLASMSILHNCAGIDQNKKYFHQEPDMVDVIAWYAKNTSEEENVRPIHNF